MGVSGGFTIVKVFVEAPVFVFEAYGKVTSEMLNCLEKQFADDCGDDSRLIGDVKKYINGRVKLGFLSRKITTLDVSQATLRVYFVEGEEQEGSGYGDILTIPGYYDYEIIGIELFTGTKNLFKKAHDG